MPSPPAMAPPAAPVKPVKCAVDPVYKKYFKLKRMHMPIEQLKQKIANDGLDPSVIEQDEPNWDDDSSSASAPSTPAPSAPVKKCSIDPAYKKYFKLKRMHMPIEQLKQKIQNDGLDPSVIEQDEPNWDDNSTESTPSAPSTPAPSAPVKKCSIDPAYKKYFKLKRMHMPIEQLKQKIQNDGLDPSVIEQDEPYERIAIHFSPGLLRSYSPQLLASFNDRPLGRGNLFSGTKYPNLCIAFQKFDFQTSTVQRSHIFARLLLFLSELADVYQADQIGEYMYDDSSELVGYVNEHLFDDLSVNSISQHFMKSTAQISRDFKKATGSPVWVYIRIKRLLAAQAMIQQGESPAKVCISCGFSDYSAFFRAYKSHFGYPPSHPPVYSAQK